ncbi:MAG: tRNA uridine-5-carboxymethylaminomethyl(34) synthesis GTPase MnmE [Gammaproteobacteria bacterium]|nr:MAG: tRNA uridine-5-carboxymethylaminomethyl(34) synthesis GTPase MnmE [Gammaproteobacteria bacterium]
MVTATIVAPATAPGRGGVGIVRISGPLAARIARQFLGALPAPRHARYGAFRDERGEIMDSGLALYFPAPHSCTGEDVLELHAHGSPIVLDLLVKRAVSLGARLARPGEFSERAFLNGKLDLAQAEAVADLIASGTEQAARAAQRSLQGEFSARVNALVERITALRAHVEAAIDFAEEDLDFLTQGKVAARLDAIEAELVAIRRAARQGSLLSEGLRVVIAGQPNVGKSSLLNRLAGRDAAIVTATPGTTRDVLREHIQLDGLPLHIMDTAGLRESADPIEQEGIRRAREEIARADRVLLLVDDRAGVGAAERDIIQQLPADVPRTIVYNKIDLSGHEPWLRESPLPPRDVEIGLSAKTGAGMELLIEHLKQGAGYQEQAAGIFSARRRHLDALQRAHSALAGARAQLQKKTASELLAEELRQAQNALSEITGAFTTEDLLGKIFSSFCIGK